ncbi:hypothetical protein Taro_020974 [Colocasia esculenta]|uniref:Uncharacterized protein n=1 Tax=Colocasia esculenta TaxID=4460 RepID=A0A843UQ28_COLES|nr:hypothetical protein [Colocasia esculenta]
MMALCGRDKIEPAQASQFITRSIQGHLTGPIHRFNDFPMDVQKLLYQMFMATSAFTTPGAPGTAFSEVMGFIRDEISGLESRLVHTMHIQVSDTVQAQLS